MNNRYSNQVIAALIFAFGVVAIGVAAGVRVSTIIIAAVVSSIVMVALIVAEWIVLGRPGGPNDKTRNNKQDKTGEEQTSNDNIIKFVPNRYQKPVLVGNVPYSEQDTCVMCGRYVPEGSWVCSVCQKENG